MSHPPHRPGRWIIPRRSSLPFSRSAKQADLVDTRATVALSVPPGWRVTDSAASFRVTGQQLATTTGATTVTLTTPLAEDLLLDVTVAPVQAPR